MSIFAAMTLRIFFAFVLSLWGSGIWAQELSVSIDEPIADFGIIIDNRGPVTHRFIFVNESTGPMVVDKVTTSCGCTSSNWSTDTISSGGEGFVEIEFDPNNRPGPFEKHAEVHFNGQPTTSKLVIRGFVKPASASIEEEFPVRMGDLRVRSRHLDLGTITKKSLFSKSFEVYNQSEQILVFSDDMEGPNHITVTYEPYTLKPKSTGKMWIHYDVSAKNDLGYFSEDITVFTYESADASKRFNISTTLLDLPAQVTPESPRIRFEQTEIDFGIKQQGDTVKVVFPVRNSGKSTLTLKKVFGNCNCIQVSANERQLAAGESADIAVRFTTNERLGNQEKTVTVFTDDPLMPVAILKLKGRLRGPRN